MDASSITASSAPKVCPRASWTAASRCRFAVLRWPSLFRKLDLGVGTRTASVESLAYPIAIGERRGRGHGARQSVHDVTEEGIRCHVRDAARQLAVALHNAWTHNRLREKSIALAEQGDRLTRANKVKTEFLASMSHGLRTPLSAILGFAGLADVLAQGATFDHERESPWSASSANWRSFAWPHINDVLDLSPRRKPAASAEVRPALGQPGAVGASVRRRGRQLAGWKRPPPRRRRGRRRRLEAVTDSQRVRQILLNLLSNAHQVHRSRVRSS